MNIDTLLNKSNTLINRTLMDFTREDFNEKVVWDEQMIGIKGARGVGKSTFMLQYLKKNYGTGNNAMYISLDDLAFTTMTVVELAEAFYQNGGKHLFLDEVHKYPNWSQELKNIYDFYPDLQVVFTSSSVLHVQRGSADLSRRAVMYSMEGLSFREYLILETKRKHERYSLQDVLSRHNEICADINQRIRPIQYFNEYLKGGFYPFYLKNKKTYAQKLLEITNLILEVDIAYLNNVELRHVAKLKKLLYMISQSVPFQPNVSKLAAAIETSRPTVLNYLEYLSDGNLVSLLKSPKKNYELMTKPEKIFLHNTNLIHAIGTNVEVGNVRETFFYNQLNYRHKVEYSAQGDFMVDGQYIFEVGGADKSFKQIKDLPHSYIAADNLEFGNGNKVPLWLFGFLY